MNNRLINEYFEWLCNFTKSKKHTKRRKLLMLLHDIEFVYILPMDENRYDDGIDLRYRFACEIGGNRREILDILDKPCSVLEMMIALAVKCEETIMDDPDVGNRTSQWFWLMIRNLGLEFMNDSIFNRDMAKEKIFIFLDRKYKRNGEGGLFVVNNPRRDMRKVEIWYQMCWYLGSMT